MNSHKNARTTFAGRKLLIARIRLLGLVPAAEAAGIRMLRLDTQKLGRIVRPSHRVTGDRRDSVDGAGWEVAHVAIDDHSRVGFVQVHADEKEGNGGRVS